MADSPTKSPKRGLKTMKSFVLNKFNNTSNFKTSKRMSVSSKNNTEQLAFPQLNSPKKSQLEENLTKEDGMIKGFLFDLMKKEITDEFVDFNFNKQQNSKTLTKITKPKKRRFGQINPEIINSFNNNTSSPNEIEDQRKFPFDSVKRKTTKNRYGNRFSFPEVSSPSQIDRNKTKYKTTLITQLELEENKENNSVKEEQKEVNQNNKKNLFQIGDNISNSNDKTSRSYLTEDVLLKNDQSLLDNSQQFFGSKQALDSRGGMDRLVEFNKNLIKNHNRKDEEVPEIQEIINPQLTKLNTKEEDEMLNKEPSKLKVNNFLNNDSLHNTVNTDEKNIFESNLYSRDLKSYKNVYDSLSDYEEEETEHRLVDKYDGDSCIIHPESNLKALWDYIMLLSVIYCVFVYPYRISFRRVSNLWDFFFLLDCLIDLVFIIDLIFTFFTPYYDKQDNLIFDKWMIFKQNLINFPNFTSDLFSSIPIALFRLLGFGFMQNILVLFRFNRILKLFKVDKHSSVISHQNSFYRFFFNDSSIARSFRYGMLFVFIIHICSCIWIWIGFLDQTDLTMFNIKGLPEFSDTWIQRVYLIGNGQAIVDSYTEFDVYICSLYFTMTTVYTIGYGDIVSRNIIERIYNNVFMVVGVMLYSFAVSNLSTAFAQKDKATKRFYKKLKILEEIRSENKLPDSTFEKIKKNLTYNFKQNMSGFYDEKYKFLKSLPKMLKNEITMFIYKKQLKNLHFFQEKYMKKNFDFILSTLPHLLSSRMTRGELIFKMGDIVEELYIVRKGCLSLFVVESFFPIEIAQIPKNYNFGEILMYSNESSPFSLKVSSTYVEMMVLKKDKFTKLKIKYPGIVTNILKEGWEFYCFLLERRNFILENISQMDSSKLTDPLDIKKQVRQLKLKFFDGISGNKLRTSNAFNTSLNDPNLEYLHNEENQSSLKLVEKKETNGSFIDMRNFKSEFNDVLPGEEEAKHFKLDQQMKQIEKTLDEELNLIREIKRRNSRGKTIKEENKLRSLVQMPEVSTYKNSKRSSKQSADIADHPNKLVYKISTAEEENISRKYRTSDYLKSTKNIQHITASHPNLHKIRHSKSFKPTSPNLKTSQKTKSNSEFKINLNYFHIENNINEHYLMMDQNININRGENTKNKLIDLVSNNKSLKKKIIRQETNVRNMLTKDPNQVESVKSQSSLHNDNAIQSVAKQFTPSPSKRFSTISPIIKPRLLFQTLPLRHESCPDKDYSTINKQVQAMEEILKLFKCKL